MAWHFHADIWAFSIHTNQSISFHPLISGFVNEWYVWFVNIHYDLKWKHIGHTQNSLTKYLFFNITPHKNNSLKNKVKKLKTTSYTNMLISLNNKLSIKNHQKFKSVPRILIMTIISVRQQTINEINKTSW